MADFAAFVNRLGKNIKLLKKWVAQNQLEAWRLYDKDIPQFPFAIDVYGDHIHMQEYDTGWKMHPVDYASWLDECIESVMFVSGFPKENIHLKKRSRQKGLNQYEKTGELGQDFVVTEYGRRFWVNLDKYLDTGLFLDHRNTRKEIADLIDGKRFLNLFAYTGSFTVYAATAGALMSETVDLSNTYLSWARKNFYLNDIDESQHQLIRQDVFQYLQSAKFDGKVFDVIVMDPPSFSNSKKMLDILDVQRDHITLINGAMSLLSPKGVLYFSNNFRGFEMDEAVALSYSVANITEKTLPKDFRNKKIHQCWTIKHR